VRIIDAHVHYSKISAFEACAKHTSKVNFSYDGYTKETQENNVVSSICMGLFETAPAEFPDAKSPSPMLIDLSDPTPQGMSLCLGINPHTLNPQSLYTMEELISNGKQSIVGVKIYAGYYHVDMNDPVYEPVYTLMEKHNLVTVIHTGDTYSTRGMLKYAHPLGVDEVAVRHPNMKIVACHIGTPWIFDACEVAAKNPNVYLDTSGLFVDDASFINEQSNNPYIVDRYKQALAYLNNYDKIIYGSDWPLAPMKPYIDFCKKIIPPNHHEKVFYENAVKVFGL
jgi:predicted TIM-barrel fold metal-dependent hydrolase